MKNVSFLLLSVLSTLCAQSQVLENYMMSSPDELRAQLEKLPEMCTLESDQWANAEFMRPVSRMKNKFTIIHFAVFSDIESIQTMEALARIQVRFPQVNIFLVNAPDFGYPSTEDDIGQELKTLRLPFPVMMQPAGKKENCAGIDKGPATLFVSPDGKLMQQKKGVLYYEQLESAMEGVLKTLNEIRPMDRMPFLGQSPQKNEKFPILRFPSNIEINRRENYLYVSDLMGHRIIGVTPSGDMVLNIGSGQPGFADGSIVMAQFNGPRGMAFDPIENVLYVADSRNHRIRKVDLTTEEVTTLLGNGSPAKSGQHKVVGTSAPINYPTDLVLNQHKLYIAMAGTSEIWICDVRTGVAEKVAGSGDSGYQDGNAMEAKIGQPMGLALDKSGALFFTDAKSSSIRALDQGKITTIAGQGPDKFGYGDGKSDDILFRYPSGLCLVDGALFIADMYNHSIRKLAPFRQRSETIIGSANAGYRNGPSGATQFARPSDVKELNGILYIADAGNGLIRTYNMGTKESGVITIFNYKELAQGFSEGSMDVRDADTLRIGKGVINVTIEINLGDNYNFDATGYTNISLVSREDSIQLVSPGFESGKAYIAFHSDDIRPETNFAIDYNLYFSNAEAPELQYFRAVTFQYFVMKTENGSLNHRIITYFDPDAEPLMDDEGEMR